MPASRIARLGRLALLLAPLLIAAALFFTVWSTYGSVSRASELLVRGQTDLVHDRVRTQLGPRQVAASRDELDAVLESLAPDGLVFIASFDGQNKLVASAGEASDPPAVLEAAVAGARLGEPIVIGERVRAIYRGRANPAARPATLIEVSPHSALELQADARRTLAVGALTAFILLAVALALVRWLLRREAALTRVEQERRLASLGRMSAVLAHEIRNPLASLKGNAQLLQRGLPEAEKSRTRADRVVAEAVRLEALLNNLLAFARTGELHRKDVDPVALVREVTDKDARVEVEAAGAPARWRLDEERMRQVLQNLVENALQAGEGKVEVAVTAARDTLRISVRDHGGGIAAEDLDKIFEPFFTRRTSGTGLGLAVARRVVDLHGGSLIAANAEGGGALFTVEIPRF